MNLKLFIKNRTVKNAWYIIIGKIIQMAFSLVVGMLTARYLGPSNYGLINYAGAYTGFFASICTLGINNVLVKEFIDNPVQDGIIIGTTLTLRALSSLLSAIIIIIISFFVDAGETTTILVVGLASIGMIFHISETFNFWFQSRLESKVTAIATLVAYIVSALYKISLLVRGKPVTYFALVSSIDYFCLGIIQYYQYRKRNGSKLGFSLAYGKLLFNKSKHFIMSGLMISIYGQTDKLMLKQLMGDSEVGYYATAVSLSGIWCFILSAIIHSMYPSIMEADKSKDDGLFRKRNIQLYAIVFYLSLSVSAIFTIFASFIIGILYGDSYLSATAPLRIVTWYTAFSYLGVARNAWVVAKEQQKHLFKIYAASALANVLLNIALIPIWGASGAAVASLAAQIFTTFVVPFFIPSMRENAKLMLEAVLLKGIVFRSNSSGELH